MCLFLYFSYFQLNLGNKSGRGSGVSMALQNLVNSAISGTDANKDTSAKTSRSPSLSGFSLKSFCLHYDIWIYLIKTSNRWIHSEFCFVSSLWTSEFFFFSRDISRWCHLHIPFSLVFKNLDQVDFASCILHWHLAL